MKLKVVEGLGEIILDKLDNPNSLNRGCSNFICDSDPNTYDRYEKRIYSSDEKPEIYDNCSNISPEEAQYHNPELNVCTKEICCENRTCLGIKEQLADAAAVDGRENICGDRTFIPNAYVPTDYGNELAIRNMCCSASTSENDQLFDRIIEFRNNKGGNISNGNNISGIDIRNYIYYSLLDLVAIDILNSPLLEESRVDGIKPDGARPNQFKEKDERTKRDSVYQDNCSSAIPSQQSGLAHEIGALEYYSDIYFPIYPAIGDKYAFIVRIPGTQRSTSCNDLPERDIKTYPWLNDKETLKYIEYDLLSKWITGLDPSNSDDINKLILISDLEVNTNLRDIGGLDNIFNIIDSSSSVISKESIKRYIINLTKEIDINNTSVKTTPLDRFFHTSINNYDNSLINKNVFSGLLNQ